VNRLKKESNGIAQKKYDIMLFYVCDGAISTRTICKGQISQRKCHSPKGLPNKGEFAGKSQIPLHKNRKYRYIKIANTATYKNRIANL